MRIKITRRLIARAWLYFRRGHNTYLAYILTFLNFIVIQYRLLIQKIPFLAYLFKSLIAFSISVVLIYVPICILIGYLDYKKFSVPEEVNIMTSLNPFYIDLAEALYYITNGDLDTARKILEKWIRQRRSIDEKRGR